MPAASDPPTALTFRRLDRAAFAAALLDRLRAVGVATGLSSAEAFADALRVVRPDSRSRLYWTARITLVRRHTDLAAFDAVFDAVFADTVRAVDPHARRRGVAGGGEDDTYTAARGASGDVAPTDEGLPWATPPRITASDEAVASAQRLPERLPSQRPGLDEVPFDELDSQQLTDLGEWFATALRQWPTRRSRRRATHPHGSRIALRETVARSRRSGWEPFDLVRSRPVRKPRRVVMLCDVSQSMQAYATTYLHLMRATTLATDAEVFAFSTKLTRLTSVLAHRSTETAIAHATTQVTDRFGGTQLATSLRTLLRSHHGGAVRGAIVVIASDGWDADDPETLARAMAVLHRRAYRVVWLNPRVAAPGFQPLVGSLAAALPYCDQMLSAHDVPALAEVVTAVGRWR
jgi:uncharacterized protein